MRGKQTFFMCKHCGNVVGMIVNAGVTMACCGDKMEQLVPNTADAAGEKHLPVVSLDSGRLEVRVGSADHPMTAEHYIEWIYIETRRGGQRKCLSPGDAPRAVFRLEDDEPLAAYVYCNLHSLWETAL